MAFRASPQHSPSKLGSAFSLRLNSGLLFCHCCKDSDSSRYTLNLQLTLWLICLLIDGEQFDVEDEGGAAGDAWLGQTCRSPFRLAHKLEFIRLMASPRHSKNRFSLCSRLAHKLEFTHWFSLSTTNRHLTRLQNLPLSSLCPNPTISVAADRLWIHRQNASWPLCKGCPRLRHMGECQRLPQSLYR